MTRYKHPERLNYGYNGYEQPMFKMIGENPLNLISDRYVVDQYGNLIDTYTNEIKNTYDDNKDGYKLISLMDSDGNYRTFRPNRLCCYAFNPNERNDYSLQVSYKNGNNNDNYYKNLQWATQEEMMRINLENGKRDNGRTLSDNQVHKICQMFQQKLSNQEICNNLGIKFTKEIGKMILRIKQRLIYKNISEQYDFEYYSSLNSSQRSEEEVRKICQLLSEKKSGNEICNIMNMKVNSKNTKFISDIKVRKTYKKISKDYNF